MVAFAFILQDTLGFAYLVALRCLEICGVASAELVPIRSAGEANGVSGFLVIEPALLVRIGGIRLFRWREADLFADWYVFTVFVLRVEMLVIKFLIVLHNSFLL